MLPTSEELEDFHSRLRSLDSQLTKLKGAEVTSTDLKSSLSEIAKEWLRISQQLRSTESFDPRILDQCDDSMQEVLKSTTTRARSSAHQKKLETVLANFVDQIIVPLIRHEGSPTQVAARQLQALFSGKLTPDEVAYVDEAARCLTVRCYRAAIIMLWGGAIARLHRAVENAGFAAFNAAMTATTAKKGNPYSRVQKGSPISSLPELQKVRDFDLLVVGMELWKYDMQAFEELERLLGIRNNAAHPGMLHPGAMDVQQFASKLCSLVFAQINP